jgi:hypothetical protein
MYFLKINLYCTACSITVAILHASLSYYMKLTIYMFGYIFTLISAFFALCWFLILNVLLTCITVYQWSKTSVMHFLFNLLRIKGLYMFLALLAHPQEVLHKLQLVNCVRVMSVGCYQHWSGAIDPLQSSDFTIYPLQQRFPNCGPRVLPLWSS